MFRRLFGWSLGVLLYALSSVVLPAFSQQLPPFEQASAKLDAALARDVSLNVEDVPLRDIISKLSAQVGVPMILARKIEDAGVSPTQTVTFSLRNVTLRTYLRNLLEKLHLTYFTRREVIVITTREDADSSENLLTRVYSVKDLLAIKKFPSGWVGNDPEELCQLIRGTINADGWQDRGGSSAINGFNQSLVLTSRNEVHEQVVRLLAVLRQAKGLQKPAGKDAKLNYSKIPVSLTLGNLEELAALERADEALLKTVSYRFDQVPLKEVAAKLSADSGLQILLGGKIEDDGVNPDDPVSLELGKVSLRTFLERLLGDLNLTFQNRDGLIRITTVEDNQSPENMVVRAYPVRDLVESTTADGKPQAPDFDPLIDTITTSIEADSWGDGHPNGIIGFDEAGVLVIAQREDIHKKIANLISSLRKAEFGMLP